MEIINVIKIEYGIVHSIESYTDPYEAEKQFVAWVREIDNEIGGEEIDDCLDSGFYENKYMDKSVYITHSTLIVGKDK